LRELAEAFPEHAPRLMAMVDRLWDQLDIFKKHVRDYRFGSSNSLKSVLPVIVPELSYKLLAVCCFKHSCAMGRRGDYFF